MKGRIFKIQRFSTEDGPGIRTTIFLKGCPLRCWWCHNPEGISPQPTLMFNADLCLGCRACEEACEHGAHDFAEGQHEVRREHCQACRACERVCPAGATAIVGDLMEVDDALAEARRDRAYFEETGGGITLSGGEPLAQPDFALELAERARAEGLSVFIETSGYVAQPVFARVLSAVDGMYFDIKHMDPKQHRLGTGVDLARIHSNFRLACRQEGLDLRVRMPLIPGYNDSEEVVSQASAFLMDCGFKGPVEMLPYHSLGCGKCERYGIEPRETLTPGALATPSNLLAGILQECGLAVQDA